MRKNMRYGGTPQDSSTTDNKAYKGHYRDQGEGEGIMKPQGELYGDDKPMRDEGGSYAGSYKNSMGDKSHADLMRGHSNGGKMKGTKSDGGYA